MPIFYVIPPSFENLTWPFESDPNNPDNYNKFLFNENGIIKWSIVSSFSFSSILDVLTFWYDFTDAAYSTSSINDKSGKGKNAIANTGLSYATNANTQNIRAVTFNNAAGINFPLNTIPHSGNKFMYVVCGYYSYSTPTNRVGTNPTPMIFSIDGSVATVAMQTFNSTNPAWLRLNGGTTNAPNTGIENYFNDKFFVLIIQNNQTNHKVYVNGREMVSVGTNCTFGVGSNICLFNNSYVDIGGWQGQYGWVGSFIYETFCTNTADDNVRQQLEGFLAHKYTFNNNLDVSHPYRDTAP